MRASDHKTRRGRGIRWHLFQVLLLSILPIGLFAAGLFYLHWRAQEHERERSQVQLVRLLAAAVDNALDSTVERLSILASLWGSSPVSDEDFYARAKDALRNNADWSELRPLRTDDEILGGGKQAASPLDVWRRVITDRRPLISNVLLDPETGTQSVYVGVPVVRDGKVTHVLIAKLDLRWYDRLLTRQGLPQGGVAGLFDQDFKFVARSVEGSERRGGSPSEALVGDMKQKREGIGRYTNLNGVTVYTAWSFSRHGWGVGIATPAAPIEDPFWKHLISGVRRLVGGGGGPGHPVRLLQGAPDHCVAGVARGPGATSRRGSSDRRPAGFPGDGDRSCGGRTRGCERAPAVGNPGA